MLLPIHFSMPPGVAEDFDLEHDQFRVIWYAKFDDWYLITWEHLRDGGADEVGGNQGQSIWNGRELKGWEWFGVDIGQASEKKRKEQERSADPRSRVNPNEGKYGIPPMVANKLFDQKNRVWFQPKRWD